ncbi:DUF2147 domain-containing protein [Lutimaribacter saemankumensis]|uniref:DUF2147 domain-containing protein n=1 Tax=Lutimaribacter saemankumensis TaxID=490829 RepID=A0A1G8LGC7_9RHOB|nr:DUF2147 domain-containing protein [Lutimaribacter saemankumensis]SDI54685.1 hypothetical protein SAMN05421850_103295 [Lutimaribacter saemankumensis]
MTRFAVISAIWMAAPGALQAEAILGTWLTGPDNKSQVAHMRIKRCGPAICGTVLRAFDKSGQPVTTPNVGKQVIWDVTPDGQGVYRGKVLLPLYKTVVDGMFDVSGDRLTLKGCLGPVCKSQSWTRVE